MKWEKMEEIKEKNIFPRFKQHYEIKYGFYAGDLLQPIKQINNDLFLCRILKGESKLITILNKFNPAMQESEITKIELTLKEFNELIKGE